MMARKLAALATFAACGAQPTAAELRAPPPLRPTPEPEMATRELPPVPAKCEGFCVDWRIVTERTQLRIDFVVHNRTTHVTGVVDWVAAGRDDGRDAVVVRADADSNSVAFSRAWVRIGNGFNQYKPDPYPRLVDVAAGADYAASVHVDLPLGPWRYGGLVYAIQGHRVSGVFEIAFDDHAKPDANPRDLPLLRGSEQLLPRSVELPSPEEQRVNDDRVQVGPEPVW